ncbi:MAG: type II toxin-antitoxin system mRNA interferase toxin, RelE/StbE family [Pseudomonadota bacterium]
MERRWRVFITPKAQKLILKAPKQVREKCEYWLGLIEESGPTAVRVHNMPSFRDHALIGNWKGHRSSYLNSQYRVIYAVDEQEACVIVKKIGPHDY